MPAHAAAGRMRQLLRSLQPASAATATPTVGVAAQTLPITDVKCYTVGTRSDGQQLMVGNGRALIIVKVETADGHTGWGVRAPPHGLPPTPC